MTDDSTPQEGADVAGAASHRIPDPVSSRRALSPLVQGYQGRRAGVVTRVIAAGIDYAVAAVVTAGSYVGIAVAMFLLDPRGFTWPQWTFGVVLAVGFGFLVVILTSGWAGGGRTAGCSLMGIRVVDRRGRVPSLPLAFVRAVACAAFPVGVFWAAVSRGHRSVQDVVLRTSVVYDWPSAVPPPSAEEFEPAV